MNVIAAAALLLGLAGATNAAQLSIAVQTSQGAAVSNAVTSLRQAEWRLEA